MGRTGLLRGRREVALGVLSFPSSPRRAPSHQSPFSPPAARPGASDAPTTPTPTHHRLRDGQIPRPIARLPKTTGCDLAGTIEAPAPGGRFKAGDRVLGILPAVGGLGGSCAEFALVPESQLAPLPASLTFAQGAAIPLACLTAWQALDAGRVGSGQRVLVTAAAGGVGSFATALAAARGATVTGTASSRNAPYIKGRGVTAAVDYSSSPNAVTTAAEGEEAAKFDVAVDVMGGATEDLAYAATKDKGGRFVSIMNSGTSLVKVASRSLRGFLGLGRKYHFVVLSINARTGERLEEVLGLIEAGKMSPPEIKVFKGLSSVPAAMVELEGGHVRGKVVVQVAE